MSNNWQQDVEEFFGAFGHARQGSPSWPDMGTTKMRMRLITEEYRELLAAVDDLDFAESIDAVADLIYVAIGLGITMGVDLGPIWDEVHRSNMAKAGGPVRDDGKQLKPEGWTPPDILGELTKQRLKGKQ